MSEKILEFTTPDNKAEGETNKAEQGIVYPPEIKAKLDQSLASLSKAEKGSAEELIALQAYQAEITPLTKAREEKEAHDKKMMELVDFRGEQIHQFELEALKDLVVQVNKGFAKQRTINKYFRAEDASLNDLRLKIEDNKVVTIQIISTILAGDISKPIEALINLKWIHLHSLSSAEGLVLPTTVNGSLDINSLSSAEGLVLPTTVNGSLDLAGLSSAEGLVLPTTVNGYLNLYSLSSAEGLVLPTTLNGGLYLSNLKSAEGLTLPATLNGDLDLRSLTSAEGLVLPGILKGGLNLHSLSSDERNELRKKHPSFKIYPED
ncbi:hypothetical protein KBC40_01230 [Patescibacteria group bacterium]|nr:hypothetical protein [Patescibacteria group bacterium]